MKCLFSSNWALFFLSFFLSVSLSLTRFRFFGFRVFFLPCVPFHPTEKPMCLSTFQLLLLQLMVGSLDECGPHIYTYIAIAHSSARPNISSPWTYTDKKVIFTSKFLSRTYTSSNEVFFRFTLLDLNVRPLYT